MDTTGRFYVKGLLIDSYARLVSLCKEVEAQKAFILKTEKMLAHEETEHD